MALMSMESAKSFFGVNCGGSYLFVDIRLVGLEAGCAHMFVYEHSPLFVQSAIHWRYDLGVLYEALWPITRSGASRLGGLVSKLSSASWSGRRRPGVREVDASGACASGG